MIIYTPPLEKLCSLEPMFDSPLYPISDNASKAASATQKELMNLFEKALKFVLQAKNLPYRFLVWISFSPNSPQLTFKSEIQISDTYAFTSEIFSETLFFENISSPSDILTAQEILRSNLLDFSFRDITSICPPGNTTLLFARRSSTWTMIGLPSKRSYYTPITIQENDYGHNIEKVWNQLCTDQLLIRNAEKIANEVFSFIKEKISTISNPGTYFFSVSPLFDATRKLSFTITYYPTASESQILFNNALNLEANNTATIWKVQDILFQNLINEGFEFSYNSLFRRVELTI